jgi:hypothetical protein
LPLPLWRLLLWKQQHSLTSSERKIVPFFSLFILTATPLSPLEYSAAVLFFQSWTITANSLRGFISNFDPMWLRLKSGVAESLKTIFLRWRWGWSSSSSRYKSTAACHGASSSILKTKQKLKQFKSSFFQMQQKEEKWSFCFIFLHQF